MNKSCVISDLHLGCHSDSEYWHEIILNWGKWLKDKLIHDNINKIIICGDFFDNRSEIGVKTISVASELMDLWGDFNITMITGNHDLFYKNRNDISSISIFEGRKDVSIIDTTTTISEGNTSVTYVPWGSDINSIPKTDVIFGHLEINGFKIMIGKLAEGKTPPRSLTSKAKLIFSGHYHLRDERTYSKSKIIYVGSPYQINWGESANIPGYYVIDFDDLTYDFFENDISPKHIKIKSNDLNKSNIYGNIISVEFDSSLNEDEIEAIKSKIYDNNPLEVKWNNITPKHEVEHIESSSAVYIPEIINDFIDQMQLTAYSTDVKERMLELYQEFNK